MHLLSPFVPGETVVNALAVQRRGVIAVAGKLGVQRSVVHPIALLGSHGRLLKSYAGESLGHPPEGHAIGVQSNGKFVVGGDFSMRMPDGELRSRIVRFHRNGTVDTSFWAFEGPNGPVHALAIQPHGNIVVAGRFNLMNDVPVNNIARLFGDPAR